MFQAHCIWHRCWWIGRKISNIWEHFWRDLPSILWCMTFFFFTILFIWFHSFFVKIVIQEFENEYLPPINNHMAKALCNMHEGIGWPGLLGSLDCSHWNWAKCPKSLQGEHKKGSKEMPTVVYECACDYQLHIWHCHFALPGACNDLNVRSLHLLQLHSLIPTTCTGCIAICCSNREWQDACRFFRRIFILPTTVMIRRPLAASAHFLRTLSKMTILCSDTS